MTRPYRAPAALWIGCALVIVGLAFLDAPPARVTAAAGRQDVAKPPAPDGQAGTRSVRAGVFSEVQAVRGDKAFSAHCVACHKPEQFAGTFLDGWEGRTASGLFAMIQTSMPEGDPGSLARQAYADILAFILKTNGLPAGPGDLPSASADLKQIIIDRLRMPESRWRIGGPAISSLNANPRRH